HIRHSAMKLMLNRRYIPISYELFKRTCRCAKRRDNAPTSHIVQLIARKDSAYLLLFWCARRRREVIKVTSLWRWFLHIRFDDAAKNLQRIRTFFIDAPQPF